ncbi:hypothetical protein WA556_002737 [Blastocystis sp. ATCC 50177/Nand II]
MEPKSVDLRKKVEEEAPSIDGKVKEAQSVTVSIASNVKPSYVEWSVGDRCEALYKEDNKYYPAIIHLIDEFQIDVTVFYIGYNQSAKLDMSEIRKPTTRWDTADRLPEKDIKEWLHWTVIFHGDGNFYDTIIDSVNGDKVNIRYTKFNTYDTVRKTDLKVAVKATEQQPEDELRILPTDDKKTVNMKKRKLMKMEKDKQSKEETEYYKSKQNAWQQFQNRSQQKRKHLIAEGVIADPFKKGSIFRTSTGTARTSGTAPIEKTMTPAPKRANTFRSWLLC